MLITDAHQHFWTKEVITGLFESLNVPLDDVKEIIRDFEPQDLKPILDQQGVSQTIVVQVNSTLDNTRYFLKLADENQWIGGVVGWVDLSDPDVGKTIDKLAHPKLVGFRHQWHDEPDASWIMQPSVLNGLREIAKRNKVYELLVKPREWEYIPKVIDAVPEGKYVIDHIAKPNIANHQFDDWVEMLKIAASYPQVFCKISGMITEADWSNWKPEDIYPYILKVIEIFGVDRVMFGSDWPVCLLAGTYEKVITTFQIAIADFQESEKEKMLGKNARRIYGLQEPKR